MDETTKNERSTDGLFYDLGKGSGALYDKIHGGLRLTIDYDGFTGSPRDWNNIWSLSCVHKRHELGDADCRLDLNDFGGWEECGQALRDKFDIVEMVPLYMTDHSGVSLSITNPRNNWDSGQIGFAFLTEEKQKELIENYDSTNLRETALGVLKTELNEYEAYLNGESYVVKKEDVTTGEELDSVSGFYGSDFVHNYLYEEIPQEFLQDVIKTLPQYFLSFNQDLSKRQQQSLDRCLSDSQKEYLKTKQVNTPYQTEIESETESKKKKKKQSIKL